MNSQPLRVLLDARLETQHAGGIQQFVSGVARGFKDLERRDVRWTFVAEESARDWLVDAGPAEVRFVSESPSPNQVRRRARAVLRPIRHRLQPGRLGPPPVDLDGYDVVHFLTQQGFASDRPTIYHPYDLQHRHLRSLPADERSHRNDRYRVVAEGSAATVTMTTWGAADLLEWLGASAPAIAVVRPGLAPTPAAEPELPELPARFFLFPAQAFEHKNHLTLLQAMVALPADLHLVCTGAEGPSAARLVQRSADLGLGERVHWLGFVTQSTLHALHQRSLALVFPSRFEGWGMPVTDSLAAGIPVACSNLPMLREIAGSAALYFDPDDSAGMSACMRRLANSKDLRASLAAEGLRRVGHLSWTQSAHRLVALQLWAANRDLGPDDCAALEAAFSESGTDAPNVTAVSRRGRR